MAEKKKKEVTDFGLPTAEDIARITNERAAAAERVAQFNKTFVPTGSSFKDTALLSGTSRDVKMMMHADELLSRAADRQGTTRGQDMEFTSQAGHIEMNQDRNRIMEKQGDQQFKLGEGELGLNKDIFGATQKRYKKYGEKSDQLNLGMQAARSGLELGEYGFEPNAFVERIQDTVAKPGTGVAKPRGNTPVDKSSIYYNNIPDAEKPGFYPDWMTPGKYDAYNITGSPLIDSALGAPAETFKSIARPVVAVGTAAASGVLGPKITGRDKVRNKLRAKVRRVN